MIPEWLLQWLGVVLGGIAVGWVGLQRQARSAEDTLPLREDARVQTENVRKMLLAFSRDLRVVGSDVRTGDGKRLPPGQVTAHIRNLILKAGLQGGHRLRARLDQAVRGRPAPEAAAAVA